MTLCPWHKCKSSNIRYRYYHSTSWVSTWVCDMCKRGLYAGDNFYHCRRCCDRGGSSHEPEVVCCTGMYCVSCTNKANKEYKEEEARQERARKMKYIIINGDNGSSYSINDSSKAGDKLTQYNNNKYTITAVALGATTEYAVCNSLGGSGWCFDNSTECGKLFHAKMKELRKSEIMNISFGPNNSWAIVKNNGWCHCRGYGADGDNSGPVKAINDHNGNIKYVSMTANKSEWIVGYGNTGLVSYGLSDSVLKAIRKAADDGEIKCVKLGRRSSLYVIRSSKSWYYGYNNDDFEKAMNRCEDKRLVAIW